jgi:hypothetical protein
MLLLIMLITIVPGVNIQADPYQPLLSRQEKLSDNIAFFLPDEFEYTFDIGGEQIFLNDTLKQSIVTEYNPSIYNIPSL